MGIYGMFLTMDNAEFISSTVVNTLRLLSSYNIINPEP